MFDNFDLYEQCEEFYEEKENKTMTTKITRKEERELWEDLMDMGFIPMDVLVLPECCKYIGKDHHGNELWKGEKREYCLIKRV